MRNLSHNFGHAGGLALHDAIRHAGGIDSGIWFADYKADKSNAEAIHKSAFINSHPLTWFVLRHFNRQGIPSNQGNQLNFVKNEEDLTFRIAEGHRDAADKLIQELSQTERYKGLRDLPESYFVPKFTLSIGVRWGNPDVRPDRRVRLDSPDEPSFL